MSTVPAHKPSPSGLSLNGWLTALLLTVILLISLFWFASPVFDTDDDTIISGVMSGFYSGTPEPHTVFVNILLSGAISTLFKWHGINWYSWLLIIVHGISLTTLVALLTIGWQRKGRLLLFLLLLFSAYLPILLHITYTTTAFVLMLAGFLLLAGDLFGNRRVARWERFAGAGMIILGSMLRWGTVGLFGALVVPVVLLAWVQLRSPKLWHWFLLTALVCIGIKWVDTYSYSAPQWENFRKYNHLRGVTIDYERRNMILRGWYHNDEVKQAMADNYWSANDMRMFDLWYFMPDTIYSMEKLQRFVDATPSGHTKVRKAVKVLWANVVKHGKLLWFPLLTALLLITAFTPLMTGRERIALAVLVLTVIAVSAGLMHFAKFPPRVGYPIALFLNVMIILHFFQPERISKLFSSGSAKILRLTGVILLCLLSVSAIVKGGEYYETIQVSQQQQIATEQAVQYMLERDNSRYLILLGTIPFERMSPFTVFKPEWGTKLISAGSWLTGSPIQSGHLARAGISNIYYDPVDSPDIMLVVQKEAFLENYLKFIREHFAIDAVYERMTEFDQYGLIVCRVKRITGSE